jgi:uncharacterized protein
MFLRYFAVITLLTVLTSVSDAASFDCAKATSKNEKAICASPELSLLDEKLASFYKQTRSLAPSTDALKQQQINWIKSVGTCDGNIDCLIAAYNNRIQVLDYVDGTLSPELDPLAIRIDNLNKREQNLTRFEEVLRQRDKELTREKNRLGQLQSKIQDMKTQLDKDKQAALTPPATKKTWDAYSSENFDYTPCAEFPRFQITKEIENFRQVLVNLIDIYNDQENVDMKMRYPDAQFCMVQIGRAGTFLSGVTSAQMYVDYDHFTCSVITENCQGDLAGYDASMTFYPENKQQFNINTYRSEDAMYFCLSTAAGLEFGRCDA